MMETMMDVGEHYHQLPLPSFTALAIEGAVRYQPTILFFGSEPGYYTHDFLPRAEKALVEAVGLMARPGVEWRFFTRDKGWYGVEVRGPSLPIEGAGVPTFEALLRYCTAVTEALTVCPECGERYCMLWVDPRYPTADHQPYQTLVSRLCRTCSPVMEMIDWDLTVKELCLSITVQRQALEFLDH